MNNVIKRAAAGVVLGAVVLGTTVGVSAAGEVRYTEVNSDAPVVMTINGSEVHADEYATYMLYNMRYYESMYAQYGLAGLWDDPSSAAMLGASMPEAAKQQAMYTRVILEHFNEEGLKLDAIDQKTLKAQLDQTIQQAVQSAATVNGVDESAVDKKQAYDELIAEFGFTEDLYENFMYVSACYQKLEEHLFGEGGSEAPSDEELKQYFTDHYISAKHILISTIDPTTGETKRTDEEAKAAAQAALDRVNAGEDFDAVMNELSEDTGLAGNPDGYIFTEGEMVTEFYDGANALGEGEVSGLVKSDYGYHIIKREALDVDGLFENYRGLLCEAMGKTMDNLLSQWLEEADVQTTEVFDQITYENVYDYALVPNPKADAADTAAADTTDDAAPADTAE